jgi:hypothetical protein
VEGLGGGLNKDGVLEEGPLSSQMTDCCIPSARRIGKRFEFLLRKYLSKIPGCVHFGFMHVSDGIPKRASRPSYHAFLASSPAEKHTQGCCACGDGTLLCGECCSSQSQSHHLAS